MLNYALFVLYKFAKSGTNGSSGFGSSNKLLIDNKTLDIVKAGDHYCFRISRQIYPFLFIFGWYILVINTILGGLKG